MGPKKITLLLQAGGNAKPSAQDQVAAVISECERIGTHTDFDGWELYRIFYYDAAPASYHLTNPISKIQTKLNKTDTYTLAKTFQETLELKNNVALRHGRLAKRGHQGWKVTSRGMRELIQHKRPIKAEDLQMDLQQKGVDLRIGLDIAKLALQQLVDSVVIASGDSDLLPALRFARREGLRTYLYAMGSGLSQELRTHSDIVIDSFDKRLKQAKVTAAANTP